VKLDLISAGVHNIQACKSLMNHGVTIITLFYGSSALLMNTQWISVACTYDTS